MSEHAALWRGAGIVFALMVGSALAMGGSWAPPQDVDKACFVCHDDTGLTSSAGTPVYVSPAAYTASIHGRASIGCVGCHTDLKGVEDFPHVRDLEAVNCAVCHPDYARTTAGGVHGTASPRLAAKPVSCKDCHRYHDVFPSADPRSSVHGPNRPATCGRCHPGAGANFAKGRVHELAGTDPITPPAVVRILYKTLIAVLGAFFLAYVAADLVRSRRDR